MQPEIFAYVIAGEALSCGILGLVAAAYVCSRGEACYGWQIPTMEARFISQWYMFYPDPTMGARHLFSSTDMAKPVVREITKDKDPTLIVPCKGGVKLYAYK